MAREYKVVAADTKFTPPPESLNTYATGETFTTEEPLAHEAALVEGGILKVVGEPEKVSCPACIEQGRKRPPIFDSDKELRDHYADKHAGLEPPGGGS